MSRRHVLGTVTAACIAAPGLAQTNDWVEFTRTDSMLGPSATDVSDGSTEIDFAFADLDKDGWTDLVVARKEPVTTSGKRTNLLLMNENGVLVDRTSQYATASLSAAIGDQGFNTPTNDRDVVIVDVDNDTWLDVVTATTLSDGNSKRIGHPRVYMNLGNDGNGDWLGLQHEDFRIPQLLVSGSSANPRFCSVAAGDVTGDGFADLYFGDYDSGPQPHPDMNDRLLVNQGDGTFADESNARMTSDMLLSAFGMASVFEDMNMDGKLDIIKDSALNAPQRVSCSYDMNGNGVFDIFQVIAVNLPYHTNTGDLNRDGRPDFVVTDDGADRWYLNTANDGLNRIVVSPTNGNTFDFVSGGDDGFGGNNYIVDLDADGWSDVIITDVDVDIAGCDRRTHFYHNRGGIEGTPVGGSPTLIEESPQPGILGFTNNDLRGTHDIAVFDIDRDGGLDMVIGRCTGTFVWRQEYEAPGGGGPGTLDDFDTTSPPKRGTRRVNFR